MSKFIPKFRTLGDLAHEAGCTPQQADYIVRKCNIPHQARAGTLRLFGDDAVQQVRKELRLREARRGN